MGKKTEQKQQVYATVQPRLKELILRDADAAFRSMGAQVEYILYKYYEDELVQRTHHDKRSKREIQD